MTPILSGSLRPFWGQPEKISAGVYTPDNAPFCPFVLCTSRRGRSEKKPRKLGIFRVFGVVYKIAGFALRSRISVRLPSNSLAVLTWLRMAAVSSWRAIKLASAAFLASVTLFIRSFISPGRITSPDTERDYFKTQRGHALAHACLQLAGHGILVGQELVELAGADHGEQGQLGLSVQGLAGIVGRAQGLVGVGVIARRGESLW